MKSYGVTTSVLSTERRCELKGLPSLSEKSTCWISVLFPNKVSASQHSGFVTQLLCSLSFYGLHGDVLVVAFLVFFPMNNFV